MVHALEKTKHH